MLYEIPLTVAVEADSFEDAFGYVRETVEDFDGSTDTMAQWAQVGISDKALQLSDLLSYTRADGKIDRHDVIVHGDIPETDGRTKFGLLYPANEAVSA